MTTYEQKYGRLPDGLADLEEPPEDWQFENPIAGGKITGRKPIDVPKLNLAAILPKPKEAIEVKFQELDLDKQAKMVADEYARDTSIKQILTKFSISTYGMYKLLDRAKEMGFPVVMRGEATAQAKRVAPAKKQDPVVSKEAIKDSGHRREFETGAVRDTASGKGRYDLVPWVAIDELAKHCEQGATKYGERNCEKGIPVSSLIDSAFRHLSKYMQGAKDEPHLRAALWNIAFAVYHEKVTPEMQDIPSRQ